MRKKRLRLLSMLLIALLLMAGCSGGTGNGDTAWEFEKAITNPLTGTAGPSELKLGNLETEGVEVIIPAGAFAEATEVSLINPDKTPKYIASEMTGFGAPIEISVPGKDSVRLLQPVTIRMKYDPTKLGEELESGSLYMGYFNGSEWQYVKPQVDREKQVMSFTTSHFSLFGQAKLTVDQRVEQYTKNAALASWAQDQSNGITNDAVERVIDHILKEKLKIDDEATKGKIIDSILKDDEWGGMLEGIATGDPEKFNQDLQVLVGKKIVDNVPKTKLSGALGALTSDFGVATVQKASEAAGYLAEGRAADAAKIIGEHIADKFMITTVGKIAVTAIDNQIQSWKSEEVEAAYQAYKNGASSKVPWWGYQVEKNNFDDVWSQMGGAARQLELEAIAAQDKARKDAGMPALDDVEKEKIRTMVQRDLKKQFEQRVKTDAEIEKKKAEFDLIMKTYKDGGFMEKGRWGWEKGFELEQRMDILMHFKDKLLKDTGRKFIKEGNGHNEEFISSEELKMISMNWFGTDDPVQRQQKYEEYLLKEFGISLAPKATELNGNWASGSMTITEFDLGPAPPPAEKKEGEEAGCDLDDLDIYNMIKASLEENKGKVQPLNISIQMDDKGSGTMTFKSDDGDPTSLAATYKDGTLTASMTEEGAGIKMTARASNSGGTIVLAGTFQINMEKSAWIKGNWNATK